jgi:multidrug resistance efflux pump
MEEIMKVLRYVCAVSMIFALFFFATSCVYAQEHQQRERWQQLNNQVHDAQARINAGVRDGSLTRPEAERLRNELKRIESDMNRAGRDGISRQEMDRLDREFSRLRKDIYREETNRERRPEKRY